MIDYPVRGQSVGITVWYGFTIKHDDHEDFPVLVQEDGEDVCRFASYGLALSWVGKRIHHDLGVRISMAVVRAAAQARRDENP